jgi:hypothetical protein
MRLLEFIDWRYSQSCWYVPLTPLWFFISRTPPPPLYSIVNTDSVWLGGGGGVLSPVGDHILQEFNTLYLTRFRTYKIARPPQTKPWGGGASDR